MLRGLGRRLLFAPVGRLSPSVPCRARETCSPVFPAQLLRARNSRPLSSIALPSCRSSRSPVLTRMLRRLCALRPLGYWYSRDCARWRRAQLRYRLSSIRNCGSRCEKGCPVRLGGVPPLRRIAGRSVRRPVDRRPASFPVIAPPDRLPHGDCWHRVHLVRTGGVHLWN